MQTVFCISRSLFAKMQKVIDYLAINLFILRGQRTQFEVDVCPIGGFQAEIYSNDTGKAAGWEGSLLASPLRWALLVQPDAISNSSKHSCVEMARCGGGVVEGA